jgi:predicted dehydrogenase
VQIDITGDEGDIRISNTSAFGDVGDDYVIEGARGDNLPLQTLDIPAEYNWLPASDLPSAVLELANLYVASARDLATGTQTAPTFDDAVWMHRLIELFETSSRTGGRVAVT